MSVVRGRLVRALAVLVAGALLPLGTTAAAGGSVDASVGTPAPPADRTSAVEARRVDRVPTPKPGWYPCYRIAECATVRVPLDYDRPKGATTEVAVLRVKAKNPERRIGSLFVNPGGPGGSGTEMALAAPYFLPPALLNRFDIVGFDPRGTVYSDQVSCFESNADQGRALAGLMLAFPFTVKEEAAAVTSSKQLGRACSSTGRPMSASMSTAQVARDMDVIRRAVGDRKLTYLGFSYGSYLGQVYANMYPDRVRAVAIDGVLDPVAWAGTAGTASRPQTDRLRSADGASRALREILVRCDRAGGKKCVFAAGDPVVNYDLVAKRLMRKPLVLDDPWTGERFRFTYADMVATTLSALYGPFGYEDITWMMADLLVLTEPPAARSTRDASAKRTEALKSFSARLADSKERDGQRRAWDFPYDNSLEAFTTVLCTDGLNPYKAASWPAAADAADRRAKYFGRLWTWSSSPCAGRTWTAKDEDAYRGPFNRRTVAPVLVVGARWDPATNHAGAVRAAGLLPNSRLLTSDNWGHTSYGSSACVDTAVNRYLLTQRVPARGTVCRGDIQPFEDDFGSMMGQQDHERRLPPVVPPYITPPSD